MPGRHSLNAFILKSWRGVGWGSLTLTHNNLIYLCALIGVAHSIVNKKNNIYSDFTFQKLMLSTFTKTFILF